MKIQDKVKELIRVPASQLRSNPKNWRIHTGDQTRALEGAIKQVGFTSVVYAWMHPEHGLEILDGHLRQTVAGDEEIPVIVLDVNQQEADIILATTDPLAMLAETDGVKLQELIGQMEVDDLALRDLLDELSGQAEDHGAEGNVSSDRASDAEIEEMEMHPFEHHSYVMLMCRNSNDFDLLKDVFGIKTVKATLKEGLTKIGVGRVVPAVDALKIIISKADQIRQALVFDTEAPEPKTGKRLTGAGQTPKAKKEAQRAAAKK